MNSRCRKVTVCRAFTGAALLLAAAVFAAGAASTAERPGHPHQPRRQPRADDPRRRPQGRPASSFTPRPSSTRPSARWPQAFMKKYPFVKMTFWRGDTEEIIAKVSAEMRANNLVADVFEGSGGGEIAVEAGFTQPFRSPDVPATTRKSISIPRAIWTPDAAIHYFSIAYNTRQVPADKVPKTYADLLNPQWKGKMAWPNARATGTLSVHDQPCGSPGARREARWLISSKLSEQKIINFASGSARTLVDRVIAGEYPIAINIYAHHPLISAGQGRAGQFAAHGTGAEHVGLAHSAQGRSQASARCHAALRFHPEPREGQEIMAKAEYFPVRSDVPPQGRAGVRHSRAGRRAGALRQLGSAQRVHRKLGEDLRRAVPVR